MDDVIHTANGAIALASALALSWVVLSARVQEGLVMKCGLVLMIFGLVATAWLTFSDVEINRGLRNAGFITRLGLLVAIVGFVARARCRRSPRRRASDFMPFDTGLPPVEGDRRHPRART